MVARGYGINFFFVNQRKGSAAWNKVLLAILAEYSVDRASKRVFCTWFGVIKLSFVVLGVGLKCSSDLMLC